MKTGIRASAKKISRRNLLKSAVALSAAIGFPQFSRGADEPFYKAHGTRINQSVAPWCFRPLTVEELSAHSVKMGIKSVELITPQHFPSIRKHGLTCAMVSSHGFAKGFAHREEHAECLQILRERIDATAAAGFPNVITFSGFRRGLSDEEANRNMVDGLKQIVGYAEEKKVTLCLEMLNSKVNVEMKGHPDYFCDDIDNTVAICQKIGSERLKVLFDIYHVQIMHGDIVSRLKQHMPFIGHIHTAGNPGRGEIDGTQEINYRLLMKVLAEGGYKGFVGQEFIPVRDKLTSLNEAVKICDV
ncbi:MAG: TIM barrel protein [Verrucomicrobia bacterium]|nr:TIM barrel protein [Verrucomicrobiota bacterium]